MKKWYAILIMVTCLSANAQVPVYQWAREMSCFSSSYCQVTSIATDNAGNVFSTGHYVGIVDFDPGAGVVSYSAGGEGAFLTKYDASGNYVWSVNLDAGGNERVLQVRTDNAGDVYICGFLSGTVDFDPSPGIVNLGNPAGGNDGFFAKYSNAGNLQWVKGIAGSGASDVGVFCIVSDASSVYIGGSFTGTTDFDPSAAGTANLTSFSGTVRSDLFYAKYDLSGNYIWAFQIGGNGLTDIYNETIYDIEMDGAGNIYVAGGFQGTNVDFDPGPGSIILPGLSNDYANIFFAKYNSAGGAVWAKQATGGSNFMNKMAYSIELDASNNIIIAGEFGLTVDFDPSGSAANVTATSGIWTFFAKYDNNGNYLIAKAFGGTDTYPVFCKQMDINPANGAIYITGQLNSFNADMDPNGGTYTLTNSGPNYYNPDGFISAYDAGGNFLWASGIGSGGDDYGFSVYYNAGSLYLGGNFRSNTDFDFSAGSALIYPAYNAGYIAKYAACTAAPSQPGAVTGNITVCSGSSQIYSVASVADATSYSWSFPAGWSGSSTTNSVTVTAGATSGNITVTASNGCGTSAVQTLAVSAGSIPASPSLITGSVTVCSGSVQSYAVTNDITATSYTWSLPAGWSGSSTSNSITATAGATGGNITVTANNSCGSSTAQTLSVTVNTTPSTPGSILGTATVCTSSLNTYSITSVGGATSYTWTLPASWTGTSMSNSITATAGASGGTISVTASNSCGTSAAANLNVTVNTAPAQPSSITGNISVCEGASENYSVTNDPSATGYTWSLPATWNGSSITNSISSAVGSGSGQVTVTANNTCGSSTSQTLNVTVNPLPTVSLSLNATSVCVDNAVFAFSGGSPASGSFSGPGTGAGNFNAATAGVGTHNITYTFTDANGCTNSNTDQITVNNCTSISNFEYQISNFEVYPNPFTDAIHIEGDFSGKTVSIINSLGEIVLVTTITSNVKPDSYRVQTSNFTPGIYFLNIISENGVISRKIIKE